MFFHDPFLFQKRNFDNAASIVAVGQKWVMMYHQQQNKWYPQRRLLAHFEVYSILAVANLLDHMLLWASKFATVKIECSFEMGKHTPLGVPFILLLMVRVFQYI